LLLGWNLIILRKHRTQNRVDNAEHGRVGEGLHQEGLARRESQNKARGEEDKKEDGDNDVGVHL
jgi:hypothetical protein